MKKNFLVFLSLLVITSVLQANFFDELINDVTEKIENKAYEAVDKAENKADRAIDTKVDSILSDEPKKIRTRNEARTTQVIPVNNKMEKLRELIEMKKNGYLTEQEFQKEKALILR